MNLEKISETENKLMKRVEYSIAIKYDNSTPSKLQLQELVSKFLKANKDNVEIHKISNIYGKSSGNILARVWNEKTFSYEKKKEGEAAQEQPAETKKEEGK